MTFRKRYSDRTLMRGKRQSGVKKNKEGFLFVTLLQSMLCAVMIAAAFVMSTIMGMTEVKLAYSELAMSDTDAVAVFSAASKAVGSEKAAQIREVFKLIAEHVFGNSAKQPRGGMLQYDFRKMRIPSGVTVASPIMASPMMMPIEGRLTSDFGPRINPVTGKDDWHTGIDLAAAEGTPIAAAWPGVVCFVGNDDIYGNYAVVDHGGFKTRYCHCSSVFAKVDTRLRQGETVAFSGNTGMSTGPHLHFELIIDGKCADPLARQPNWRALETV